MKTTVGWVLLLVATALGFVAVRSIGSGLTAPARAVTERALASAPASHGLFHLLLALGVILGVSRLVGAIFEAIRQPPVVGEVLAGILLGPSLLGRIAPGAYAYLLPDSLAPVLKGLADLGVVVFMFVVGTKLDTSRIREKTQAMLVVSHASIAVPFLLGSTLSLALYPRLATSDVPFGVFAMFMGVAMSITAFPVLARILSDRRMEGTPLGGMAISCAAVDDVTAWCLLALVVSLAKATGPTSAFVTFGLSIGYVGLLLAVGRPLVRKLVRRAELSGTVSQGASAIVFGGLLLSALVTEAIGIHALFGAFAFGAIVPHDSRLGKEIVRRVEDFVVVLLLPAFFAYTGMRTQIGLVAGAELWLLTGAIILCACAGKFGGTTVAARLVGTPWREAASLGVLMNTRGLMELVALNIGRDLGVVPPALFAMMVIMALATTFMTMPALDLLQKKREVAGDAALAK